MRINYLSPMFTPAGSKKYFCEISLKSKNVILLILLLNVLYINQYIIIFERETLL